MVLTRLFVSISPCISICLPPTLSLTHTKPSDNLGIIRTSDIKTNLKSPQFQLSGHVSSPHHPELCHQFVQFSFTSV